MLQTSRLFSGLPHAPTIVIGCNNRIFCFTFLDLSQTANKPELFVRTVPAPGMSLSQSPRKIQVKFFKATFFGQILQGPLVLLRLVTQPGGERERDPEAPLNEMGRPNSV